MRDEATFISEFEVLVEQHGARLAVRGAGAAYTYAELNRAADRLAGALSARLGPGIEPVAMLFDYSPDWFIGVLGALKAGKFIVPLDIGWRPAQLQNVIHDSGARLMLTNDAVMALASDGAADRADVLLLRDALDEARSASLRPHVSTDSAALLLYTSGTTGMPKGVVMSQVGLLRAIVVRGTTALNPEDRYGLLTPFSFNITIRNVAYALMSGAPTLMFDLRQHDARALADWIQRERITQIYLVPSVLRQLLGVLDEDEKLDSVRVVRCGGEALFQRDLAGFKTHFASDCVLGYSYGSAECGLIASNVFDANSETEYDPLPAGLPAPNVKVMLETVHGAQGGDGDIGEIVVSSRAIAPGYWGKAELSAATFRPDSSQPGARVYHTGDLGRWLPNGMLQLMGRVDSKMKVRGQTVVLADIEAAVRSSAGVEQCAVVPRIAPNGERRIVAYACPATLDVGALQRDLRQRLPTASLPKAIVLLDRLPKTATGKVDARALPDPNWSQPLVSTAYLAPRTPFEETLAPIWAAILGVAKVGAQDDFLELGGDSLTATRIVAEASVRFGVNLAPGDVLSVFTVEGMAKVVVARLVAQLSEAEIAGLFDKTSDSS